MGILKEKREVAFSSDSTDSLKAGSLSFKQHEEGYALIFFMVLLTLGVFATFGSLKIATSHARTNYSSAKRSQAYYQAESSLHRAAGWLRENSQNIMEPFTSARFYASFTRTAPTAGGNDVSLAVPTKLKAFGTNNSVFLSSDSSYLTSTYPPTSNFQSGASFDAAAEFASIDFGDSIVRVVLVDAVAIDDSKDYGAPPSAQPETHFFPIFRVDAMSSVDSGAHVFGYVRGALLSSIPGFFGKDGITAGQDCDSYKSSEGAYSSGTANAKCPIASEGNVCIKNNATIYGSVDTVAGLTTGGSCGGDICLDSSCNEEGEACEGSSCPIPTLGNYSTWSNYCPGNKGAHTVNNGATDSLTPASAAPSDACWTTVKTKSNSTLILDSTQFPYFFETLDLANNSQLAIQPDDSNGVVTIYTNQITGDKINGNQAFNLPNRPTNFTLVYLGSAEIKLNGNADMKGLFIAPNATIDVQGNFDFYGGIIAKEITVTGNADLHFDEDLSVEQLSDMTFLLASVSQYYR
jgi:hypothetical protein